MTLSTWSGWVACALIPLAALSGTVLRRLRFARFALRMRPHYAIGYAAVALAGVHLWTSASGMAGADVLGIWCATFGFGAMLVQAFLGVSLQAPGAYRGVLRRWHVVTLFAAAALVTVHLVLNGPAGATATAFVTPR